MYYTKNTIHNIFTLAAEFTKQFYIKNALLTCWQESEQLVLSQIKGLTIVIQYNNTLTVALIGLGMFSNVQHLHTFC